jgi:hypothetical protein
VAGFRGKTASELEDTLRQAVASGVAFVSSDDVQGGESGGGNRRWRSGGEDERPAAVDQILAECAAPGRKASSGAEGLAQGSNQDIGRNPGFVTQAAPARSQQAKGVRLVDNQGGSVFAGEGCQVSQRGDVAIHAKKGLGHE